MLTRLTWLINFDSLQHCLDVIFLGFIVICSDSFGILSFGEIAMLHLLFSLSGMRTKDAATPYVSTPYVSTPITSPLLTSPLLTSRLLTSPLLTSPLLTSRLLTSRLLTSPLLTSRLLTSPLLTSRKPFLRTLFYFLLGSSLLQDFPADNY